MKKPFIPVNDSDRLQALREYKVLDSPNEQSYDALTKLASFICETPISLISLVDENRQWFKSSVGLDVKETSRDVSFCAHAINDSKKIFEIEDATKNPDFKDNPLVAGEPKIRFYAGVPLIGNDGFSLGTLCVIDRKARKLTKNQREALTTLSYQIINQLELRKISSNAKALHVRYEGLLENLEDIIFETNAEGRFIYFNAAVRKYSGFTEKELIGKHFKFLILEEDQKRVSDFYLKQIEAKEKSSFIKFRIKTKEGNSQWIAQRSTLFFDKDGNYLKAIAVVRDIHQNVLDEEELLEKTQLLESIITTMSSGVFVLNKKGEFILKNKAADELLLNDKSIKDLSSWISEYEIFSEDKTVELNVDELFLKLNTTNEGVINFEVFIKHKRSGDSGYMSFNANSLKSSKGVNLGSVIIASNINAKKYKEIDIKKRASWLDQSQNLAKVGYWEIDLIEQTVFWSEQTRKIHEVAEDYIPNLEEGINFYDEASKPIITKAVNKTINEGKPFDEKLKIVTIKNNLRWVHTIGKAHYESGKITKVLGVFQDITEQKTNEQKILKRDQKIKKLNLKLNQKIDELQKLNAELEDFTYVTTHDLKAPIANIEGFIGIIRREIENSKNEKLTTSINFIEKSINQAKGKISSLVNTARVKQNAAEKWSHFDLNILINELLDELSTEIHTSNATITREFNKKVNLHFNKTALKIALLNLISNSIKYQKIDVPPRINIRFDKVNEEKAIIEVEDNGLGLDLKKQGNKLFGMFNRFHSHTEGDGMGLYYSKKIIESNQGSLEVESKVGEGSNFKIIIPTL